MGAGAEPRRVLVSLVAGDAVLLGALRLPSVELGGATYHFRLLELLNNPRLGGLREGRYSDSLVLEDVSLLPREGRRVPVAREMFVRPRTVACAYEYTSDGEPEPVRYDPQRYKAPEPVVVALSNGMLVEGTYLGGVGKLAAPDQRSFVPVLDASLSSAADEGAPLAVPFVAVNNASVMAFSRTLGPDL